MMTAPTARSVFWLKVHNFPTYPLKLATYPQMCTLLANFLSIVACGQIRYDVANRGRRYLISASRS